MARIRTIEEFKEIHKPENQYFLIGYSEWDLIWIKNLELGQSFSFRDGGIMYSDLSIWYDKLTIRNRRPVQIEHNAEWRRVSHVMRGIGIGKNHLSCTATYVSESEAKSVYDQISAIELLIGRSYEKRETLKKYVWEIFDQ